MKEQGNVLKGKILALGLASTMLLGAVGCSKNTSAPRHVGSGEIPKTMTVFASLSAAAAKAGAKDRNDIQVYQIAEEKTGCHIKWINPTEAAFNEQFNLLIASKDLPDLIQGSWNRVSGGTKQYVEDGIIVPLSDYKDNMPNLTKYMNENPDRKAQFVNEDGSFDYVSCIRRDNELLVYVGPTIRKDWLDKLGLNMPTNTDELYNVLKAFKTQDPNGNGKNDEIPFGGMQGDSNSFGIGNITSAFGVYHQFYIKNGKITHGMIEPEMKKALTYLNKLYKEGLIDRDYLTQDADTYHGKVLNDRTGFFFGIQPSRYYATMNDGTRSLVGVPYFDGICHNPAYKLAMSNGLTAISSACKNPEGAAKWIDWFFGEDGITAFNYGVEGKTYDVVDGKKILNEDYFTRSDASKERSDVMALTLNIYNTDFPGLQLWDSYSQNLSQWGKDAINVWTKSANIENAMPSVMLTPEEQEIINKKLNDINTYSSELFNGIIVGNRNISEIKDAEEQLNNLGLKEVLKAYNAAYKRYLKMSGE